LSPYYNNGTAMSCDKLGAAIVISNRLLLPPDGITFADGSFGMLGRSLVSTRLGARDASEASAVEGNANSWMQILDASNFAGPITYASPQWWQKNKWSSSLPVSEGAQDMIPKGCV
jgi:hypothetical protein